MKLKKEYCARLDETMFSGEHKSGLRVFIIPKEEYVKTYAVIGTDFGSIDNNFVPLGEKEEITIPDGIAHFLEHKLFEQPDGGNVFESYAKYGANANAYTSFDLTAYIYETTENVIENLEILLDFVQKPYFTDENVQKEQGIIAQEINMYEDEPSWRLMMNFLSSMYHNHPVRNDIAGSTQSIAEITKETLYKCYNTFYDMSNMALFVVGKADPEEIAECVEKNIIIKGEKQNRNKKLFCNEPKSVLKSETEQKLSVSVPSFMFGFKDNDTGYSGKKLLKKIVEISVLTEIIFGKCGHLHTKLYNEGHILTDLEAEAVSERDYGFVAVSAESKNPKKVREVILAEIEKIKKKGIAEEDIDRTKKALVGNYIKMFNDVSAVAHSCMSNVFKDILPFDLFEVADSVTKEDIERRFDLLFNEDASVLSVINPM